ncbi:serine/threonine-protein phosphatase 2A activator-like isoform X2 [Penaeus japonicus]|uniref:serine/threonine-protein phosphatase 2A activator-like isoform X2 n=1 Tax=Penaeus japonicus TaxID=27405 RepID=UPI001C70F67D|nr:serine/threonine-protein phosphatase 2A activator-like isoform X2 [Penaeus japonicus]
MLNETHKFETPQRAVLVAQDVKKWEQSEAYQDILGFLISMNEAVKGKKLSVECKTNDVVTGVLKMLDTLSQWIDEIPAVDQPQRYGNKAFRDFYARLKEKGEEVVRAALSEEFHPAVPEISVYLVESVGNSTRIDYGTGHELAFLMFLTCIFKIGALKQEDSVAAVTKIYRRYLELARKLQMTYKMEPAGSQGVWSLDDYQFIPFIWGSSQLYMHPKISPEMFISEKIVNEYADEYLFLSCIKFILSVKTGPFAEHSNQLWNISGVQSWGKINQGLIKMYKAEVLHKFPVVQHVLFGSILSISAATEIKFHPPSGDMPATRKPTNMPCPSAMQGCVPPNVQRPGAHPLPTELPLMGKMPQNMLSKPTAAPCTVSVSHSLSAKAHENFKDASRGSVDMPCVKERHPAMSPLDNLPPNTISPSNMCSRMHSGQEADFSNK